MTPDLSGMKVIRAEHPVQLVRYPPAAGQRKSTFAIRVIDARKNEARDVFSSGKYTVAREHYDIERYYRCARTVTAVLAAVILSAATATASHIGYPYGPTPSSGSWDGPGMTATELIGRPGEIGLVIDFSAYASTGTVLWSITARPDGRLTQSPYDGSWSYANGYDVFNTTADPKQFAYWEDETGLTMGIEDLTGPSDLDYNDYVVRFNRLPERAQFDAVAEPSVLALAAVAVFGVARRWRKGTR